MLRQLMCGGMVIAGGLALFNIVLGRVRWLSLWAFSLVALTALLGGHKVMIDDFPDHTPYVGLDWLLLDLLGFSKEVIDTYVVLVGFHAVLNHANVSVRLGPLRFVIVTPNFHHWHHAQDVEGIDRNYAAHFAFLDHLFGTAVQVDRQWPDRYGVVGDPVPEGFWVQFKFPFTRSS